jgi:hypothetical protein
MSAAVLAAEIASSDPSVAKRIFVGKMLISYPFKVWWMRLPLVEGYADVLLLLLILPCYYFIFGDHWQRVLPRAGWLRTFAEFLMGLAEQVLESSAFIRNKGAQLLQLTLQVPLTLL